MAGTLFVVATPIGNLEDLTFRALRVLKEVDVIAAEDTRRTSKLLAHYGVSKPLVSLHEHNEHREAPKLVSRLLGGQSIALVSDAGTPGIADPGTTLASLARQAGVPVTPIPGASAVTAALSVTGLPAVPFTFLGFPPSSGQARDRWMEEVHRRSEVLVFFEAPHRIKRTLDEVSSYAVERPLFIHRELTKINEQLVEWTNSECSAQPFIPDRGEFVVVVGSQTATIQHDVDLESVLRLHDAMSGLQVMTEPQVLVALSAITGLSGPGLSKSIKKARILAKRQNNTAD